MAFDEAMADSARLDRAGERLAVKVMLRTVDEVLGVADPLLATLGVRTPDRPADGPAVVDRWLRSIDVKGHSVRWLLGALLATLDRRTMLPSRPGFYRRVADEVERRDPLRAEELLRGLEDGIDPASDPDGTFATGGPRA